LEGPGVTDAKRVAAQGGTGPVYGFDPAVLDGSGTRLQAAFSEQRDQGTKGDPAARAARFAERAGIANAPPLVDLARTHFDADLEKASVALLRSLEGRRVVARADLVAADLENGNGITERNVSSAEERALKGSGVVLDLDAARALMSERSSLTGIARRDLAVAVASVAL